MSNVAPIVADVRVNGNGYESSNTMMLLYFVERITLEGTPELVEVIKAWREMVG